MLVAIIRLEVKVEPLLGSIRAADRKDGPARVALVALFELDYLGAHIGQQRGRIRPLLKDCPINYPDAFKWCVHDGFLYHSCERRG